jgi:hypothetical protein
MAVVGDLALVSLVVFLPVAAGLLLAQRLRISSRPAQAIVGLATPCVAAYLGSIAYLASPGVGRGVMISIYVVVLGGGVALAIRDLRAAAAMLRWWATPTLMAIAAATFALALGFLHGGTTFPLLEAEIRYVKRLANDNVLPRAFAEQLLASPRPLPHILAESGPWLSSDRPPLQTCVYLLVRAVLPVGDPTGLLFEVLGALLQSLWAPALWCVLQVAGLPRRATALGLVTVSASGFVIFNSFYVWPKLFPAAFVILAVAVVLAADWSEARSRSSSGVVCGVAAAMAMLGHEGSALLLAPVALFVVAVPKLRPRFRCAIAAAVATVGLLAPWLLYQRYYDPPGTSLDKLQLAGTTDFNSHQGLVSTILAAYSKLPFGQLVSYKWSNLVTPFVHEPTDLAGLGSLLSHLFATGGPAAASRDIAVEQLRNGSYLYLLPEMGLLAIGPIAYLVALWMRRRDAGAAFTARLWVILAGSVVVWSLVLFGPNATFTVQGSYALVLLADAAAVLSLWQLSHRVAVVTMALQVVTSLLAYAVFNPRLSYVHPPATGINSAEAIVAAVALAALALLVTIGPSPEGEISDQPSARRPRRGRRERSTPPLRPASAVELRAGAATSRSGS